MGKDDDKFVQSLSYKNIYSRKKEYAHFGACTLTAQLLPFYMFGRDVNMSTESAALSTHMHNAHMHAFTKRDNAQRREYRLQRKPNVTNRK